MDAIRFNHEADDGFYHAVSRRIDNYFLRTGRGRLADRSVLAKAAPFRVLIVGSYSLTLAHPFPNWVPLPLVFTFGVSSLLMAINIGHDAAHHVLFRSPFWDDVAQAACFTRSA